MVVSLLWRGPDNILGWMKNPADKDRLLLKQTVTAVSGVRITAVFLRTCNLTIIACSRWSLVTN